MTRNELRNKLNRKLRKEKTTKQTDKLLEYQCAQMNDSWNLLRHTNFRLRNRTTPLLNWQEKNDFHNFWSQLYESISPELTKTAVESFARLPCNSDNIPSRTEIVSEIRALAR